VVPALGAASWDKVRRNVVLLCDVPQGREGRPSKSLTLSQAEALLAAQVGTPADASHVRRSFRKVVAAAGLDAGEWTPRELRHSFISLLSDAGVPIEQISRLVGHSGTTTTETVYRKQIRPVIVHGADVMDRLLPEERAADAQLLTWLLRGRKRPPARCADGP
jgi:integrase